MPKSKGRGIFSGSRVAQAQVSAHSLTQAAEGVALALQGWMGLYTIRVSLQHHKMFNMRLSSLL